jgi:lysophospholipase L1-like esterase
MNARFVSQKHEAIHSEKALGRGLRSLTFILVAGLLAQVGCATGHAAKPRSAVAPAAASARPAAPVAQPDLASKSPIKLAIVGDSTACVWPLNDPRRGWGMYLQDDFTSAVQVLDLAQSGRSTKTFIGEGWWAKTLAERPDLVLIQFGHNDSHAATMPESTRADGDFKDYLRQYIDQSRSAGAVPVLVTPVARRTLGRDGKLVNDLAAYADAMKAVAAEKQVALIDLNASSGRLYERLGGDPNMIVTNSIEDRTHFSEKGARMIERLVLADLIVAVPELAKRLAPAPKPLYRDPAYDGPTDPSLCWNRGEQAWFMFYTSRRANVPGLPDGVSWVHGTPIGIAASIDGGRIWAYRGTANIHAPHFQPAGQPATYWAPAVVESGGYYHMFVTIVPGVFSEWRHPRMIVHLTSKNMLDWDYVSTLKLASDRVIDPCLLRLDDGSWRLWYNNERDGKSMYDADSPDLEHWTLRGKVVSDQGGEGPVVFRWKGHDWMITDVWRGLAVYRSDDLEHWTRQPGDNLVQAPGHGADDQSEGHHADVVVSGDRAYLFYFTHPGRVAGTPRGADGPDQRRSSIQVVELQYKDGVITCDRDKPTFVELKPGE